MVFTVKSQSARDLAILQQHEASKHFTLPTIKVIGVGGGGCNAVSRMFSHRVPSVQYAVVNTDQQHLAQSNVPTKLAIGPTVSRG